MEFAEKLKHYRSLKRWSQEEMATKAELSQTFISELERGVKDPSLATLKQLAKAFRIPLDMFLSERYIPAQDLPLPEEVQDFLAEQSYLSYLPVIKRANAGDISPEALEAIINTLLEVKSRRNV